MIKMSIVYCKLSNKKNCGANLPVRSVLKAISFSEKDFNRVIKKQGELEARPTKINMLWQILLACQTACL